MISIAIESEDKLTRQTWEFTLNGFMVSLSLVLYRHESRQTRRHKYRTMELFTGRDLNNGNLPFGDNIKALARQQVIDRLTVEK